MTAGEQIVAMLREAGDNEVSSRMICERLGVSRAAVWKQVESLREGGYEIEACSRRGYRLVSAPDTPCAAEVLPLLSTRRLGRELCYVEETDSTNRDVAARAQAGAGEGLVVAAGLQRAGRGRQSRAWFSPSGVNLYFSLLLRPEVELARAASLPLVVGLAVAEAVADLAGDVAAQVKWPNDILVRGRKLCGILCEMQAETDRVHHIVAGVGVNVNVDGDQLPAELRERATSLRRETGGRFSRAAVLAAILNRLEPLYDRWRADGLAPLVGALERRDALRGRAVVVEQGGRRIAGRAEGLQPDGALRLQTADGAISIYSGEAHIGS